MEPPPTPLDEQRRLAALHRYDVLDTPSEAVFDRLTRVAATVLGTPIALVSLIDVDRQWFKSRVGLSAEETPRAISFCGHAINGPGVMIVPDALSDVRFADNPLVTGPPDIRFYAGAPLRTSDGFNLGTLCVIDRRQRFDISEEQASVLEDLAAMVVDELELRFAARRLLDQQQELLLAREVAERASGAKSALLARVSHELRTPLAAIKGFGELLALEPLPEPAAAYVGHIVDGGDRLAALIEDLLDLRGDLPVQVAEILLADVAADVVALLRPLAAQASVELVVDVGEATARGDRARLHQVLANLVRNALVHRDAGGIVAIRARTEPGAVVIEIIDDGLGIGEAERALVFEPFVSAHGARRGGGTGLAVAQRLIEAMDGELRVDSVPGHGTTVSVRLPPGS